MGAAAAAVRADRASGRRPLRCFVAGVQYQSIDVFRLARGHPVAVRKSSYRDETCYEVLAMDGARIGFVPRRLVAVVAERGVSAAWLETVAPHAVPWKRVEIVMVAARA
jgi:hypothetical protein